MLLPLPPLVLVLPQATHCTCHVSSGVLRKKTDSQANAGRVAAALGGDGSSRQHESGSVANKPTTKITGGKKAAPCGGKTLTPNTLWENAHRVYGKDLDTNRPDHEARAKQLGLLQQQTKGKSSMSQMTNPICKLDPTTSSHYFIPSTGGLQSEYLQSHHGKQASRANSKRGSTSYHGVCRHRKGGHMGGVPGA